MLRRVQLPTGVPGKLLLHSMPGRWELLEHLWQQVRAENVGLIICLAPANEVREKSPRYAAELEASSQPCAIKHFPIEDYGVPEDREGFWKLALFAAHELRAGNHLLIHCAGGKGRTGTLATVVLIALGELLPDAKRAVKKAGSRPEVPAQRELVAWCAARPIGA